jgi:uncharacterized membrane protein
VSEYLILPFLIVGALTASAVLIISRTAHSPVWLAAPIFWRVPSRRSRLAALLLVISGLAGLFLRLYGLDRSFWLDEFGTLWTVEGSMAQLLERVYTFHGQSPLYYVLLWFFVNVLGHSEIALRVFSLALGLATTYGVYSLGDLLFGKKTGLIAATLYWLSPATVQFDSQARPYALALLMAVVMFYGFARAARDGSAYGRRLFILGGAGLFLSQYMLIITAGGLAAAYFFIAKLRSNYHFREFAYDVFVQVLIALSCFVHLLSLWSRRNELVWLGTPNYLTLYELIGPFLILALVPMIVGVSRKLPALEKSMLYAFWLCVIVPASFLYLLAYRGTNLLHPRYMAAIIIPVILLAAVGVAKLPRHLSVLPLIYWFFFVATVFLLNFNLYGAFNRAGFQDWKTATACLDELLDQQPDAIVLYRSGFVEEDNWQKESIRSALRAPLRGLKAQTVKFIGLSYSWDKPGREEYFTRVLKPTLDRARIFYFLTCSRCFNDATGPYPKNFANWVEVRFPGTFNRTPLKVARGITLFEFVDQRSGLSLKTNAGAKVASRHCGHQDDGIFAF